MGTCIDQKSRRDKVRAMRPKFTKRHLQPLDASSYAHVAKRLRRIADDLDSPEQLIRNRALTDLMHFADRLRIRRGDTYCERCEDYVTPVLDRGDSLCPRCQLVL